MPRARMILASILLASALPLKGRAQEAVTLRTNNALKDMAQAQLDQAEILCRQEMIERDTARHNVEVLTRSL